MRVAVLMFAAAGCAHAQFKTTSTLVLAPTTVTTAEGKFVDGLKARDLILYDNGVPQPIQLEEAFNPLSLIVALETSTNSFAVLDKLGDLGVLFSYVVAGHRGEIALLGFADETRLLHDFTTDPDRLAGVLRSIRVQGNHAVALDTIQEALRLFSRRPGENRRVLLVIGEKRDRSSTLKLPSLLMAAQRQNVLIYWVTYSPFLTAFTARQKTVKSLNPKTDGTPIPRDPAPGSLLSAFTEIGHEMRSDAADELTRATGGRTLNFVRKDTLEEAVQAIGAEVHRQYILSFQPPKGEPGVYHAIRVEVKDRPELAVRTRLGYWAAM
jgi:VWFA-related protein